MKINKKLQKALDFLGNEYKIKAIDGEDCIYRDLGNGIDVEVSGICSSRDRAFYTDVYVWDISRGKNSSAKTIYKFFRVEGIENLKKLLDLIVKYNGRLEFDGGDFSTIEWISRITLIRKQYVICPVCGNVEKFQGNINGHANNCWLANKIYK